MALPYDLTNTEVLRVAAPAVALAFTAVFYGRLQRKDRGPAADYWEGLRRVLLPPLNRLLRDRELGYAAYVLQWEEYVGTLAKDPEAVEQLLWENGFVRNPLAAYKTLPDGTGEVGSWVYRESLLSRTQVHVVLFATENGTAVFAHKEPSAVNPLTAFRHYLGGASDAEAGAAFVLESLPVGVWYTVADDLPGAEAYDRAASR